MQGRQKIDAAAHIAGRCISNTLGVEVITNDADGRQGAYDLALTHEERTIAVEVKLVVDPNHRAAGTKSHQLGYTRQPGLTYMWFVHLSPDKSWKRALARIPTLLAELEGRGIVPDTAHYFWQHDFNLYIEFERLGIESLSCLPSTEKHPPGYYVMQAAWGGIVPELDHAVVSACTLMSGPDMAKLRRQLAAAETDERHAFLIYGWEYLEAIPLGHEGPLPSEPPTLPEGIDGVWLSTTGSSSATVAWLPRRGWFRAAPMI
ncbi:hypothetical protein [Streptomyces phaeochromogenes]|uniref:hypothetical protein n=1 Tax=Streptomyces phaeochromogenes TaxID=1923 RepID=UPI00386A333E|nr:hypothetical protein OHB08_18230 [Streptomyces phaeochromogenes]